MCEPATGRRKHQERNSQGDGPSPPLFAVEMTSLTRAVRMMRFGYEFTKSQAKIDNLIHGRTQVICKKRKGTRLARLGTQE